MAGLNLFATSTPERESTPERKKARSIAQLLMQQGSSSVPQYSKTAGIGQVLLGGLGGYMAGKEAADEAARRAAGSAALGDIAERGGLFGATPNAAPGAALGAAVRQSGGGGSKSASFDPKAIPSFVAMAGEPHGISGDYLTKTAWIESRGNPNAKNPSGASGIFQFMPGTARQYGLTDPFDPVASANAAARLASDNKATLQRSLGRDPTDAELYLAHQQGAGGAAKLLANPSARAGNIVGDKAVRANGGDPDGPASAFSGLWTGKYNGLAPRQAVTVPTDAGAASPIQTAQATGFNPEFSPTRIDMAPNTDSAGPMIPIPPSRPQFADMPAQGSAPVGMDAMGSQTGVDIGSDGFIRTRDGFAIPPAPPDPTVPPPSQTAREAVERAAGALLGRDNGTDPSADPAMFAPQAQATVSAPVTLPGVDQAPPTTSFATPNIPTDPSGGATLPAIAVQGGAPASAAPLPPTRPADLAYDPRADMPIPGAQNVALARAVMASGPDLSNSDTGGAREFTLGQSDPKALAAALMNYAPGQGGTSGSPDRMALAQAVLASGPPLPQSSASASGATPQQMARMIDPSVAPAPTPVMPQSANAPVSSYPQSAPQTGVAPSGSTGQAPTTSGPVVTSAAVQSAPVLNRATFNALVNSDDPTHQAVAKMIVERALSGRETKVVGGALVDGSTGAVLYQAPKDDRPADIREYEYYANQERAAGRVPTDYTPWARENKRSGASSITLNAGDKELQVTEARRQIATSLGYKPDTPEYNRVVLEGKAPEPQKLGDKALPAELGARVALAQSFLDEVPTLRKEVEQGIVTGPVDATTARTGRGQSGELLRKIRSGSEAIVRNLTGAGMNESEARARVSQYEPGWGDDVPTVLSKFDMLTDQLRRIEAEAYRGRGVPENRKGKNPYFDNGASAAPAGTTATAAGKLDPVQGGTGTVSPPVAPPASAVQHLQSNPALRDAFDLKYGKGAAARALGGK